MKHKRIILCGASLLLVAVELGVSVGKDTPAGTKPASQPQNGKAQAIEAPQPKPGQNVAVKPNSKVESQKPADQPVIEKRSADEEAIRLTGETYVKAFCAADAKLVAEHFTKDAEFIDEQGTTHQGREAIETAMKTLFEENPGSKIALEIETIRFISPGVAIEDGMTLFTPADEDEPISSRYSAVHIKSNGQWLAASVREHAPKDRRQHRAKLQQLAWLEGDWVDESGDSLVLFSCESVDGGNFLVRNFEIRVGGRAEMHGTQRIGWDPLTGKLKTWIFDSEGGYSDGFWHRNDDGWTLKTVGVTSEGQPISSTTSYTSINEDTMTWQSVDREVAGVALADSEPVTIVRRAPMPEIIIVIPVQTSNSK